MNLKEKIQNCFQQIKDASQQAGREDNSVSVLAVTKCRRADSGGFASLGVHHIGENRVDKFLEKYALKDRNITWHLIGTLQRRKGQKMSFSMLIISTLDSFKASREKFKRIDRVLKCFLQVEISQRKRGKHGFKEELLELSARIVI